MLKRLSERLLGFLFPNECGACGVALPGAGGAVCGPCESTIRLIPAPHCISCGRTLAGGGTLCGSCADMRFHFDRAYACVFYEGKVRELLHAYKFGRRKTLRAFFSKLLTRFVDSFLEPRRFDAVLAVPLDRKKENERGFNQSRLLSRALSKKLGVPDCSGEFARVRAASPQSLLVKSQREPNVRGCFTVKDARRFRSKNLLLVDDILTTGQTASECARTLKEAGASSVTVLACARGA